MNLSIVIENDEDRRNIDELLEQINAKILFHPPKNSPYFEFKENKLRFFFDLENSQPLDIDFLKGSMGWRLKRTDHEKLLKKAVGKTDKPLTIFDGTAGFLSDTLILLALGHKVIACEQSKILFVLLKDAIRRAKDALPYLDNLKIYNDNSINLYKNLENIDLVFLDPMYPEPKKHVLRSGNMSSIRKILNIESIDDVEDNVFFEFKDFGYKKLILKRPIKAGLLDQNINYQVKGKSTRFDVYI